MNPSPAGETAEAVTARRPWWRDRAPLLAMLLGTAMTLGALWAGATANIVAGYQEADRGAARDVRSVADLYEAQVLRAVREIDFTLGWVRYAQATHHDAPLSVFEKEDLPLNPLLTVTLFDPSGVPVASNRPGPVPSWDVIRTAVPAEGPGLRVAGPWQPSASEPPLLTFFRPGRPGERPSATVTVEAAFFVSAYDVVQLGERGALALLRPDGTALAWQRGAMPTAPPRDLAVQSPPAMEEAAPEEPRMLAGESSWVVVRRVVGAPVSIAVALSYDEQRVGADESRRKALWLTTVLSGVVLVVTRLLWRINQLHAEHRRQRTEASLTHARQVEHMAYHDGLTGLANRSLYAKLLAQEVARARRDDGSFALMFLDLDRFKLVNDTLGHDVGDALLKEVAGRLQTAVRAGDVVARLGGDEFVVLLAQTGEREDAAAVARRVLAALAPPCELLGHELRISASLGIAFYPRDGLDEQTLAKHADVAMYQAKQAGRNGYQFYQTEQSSQTLERMALESALRAALPRGELELYYQARRSAAHGSVTGVEALLRWRHPDLGLLPAGRFLPLAEDSGLIVPIGRWALRTGCAQLQRWRAGGHLALTLSINLSMRQFIDDTLLQDVRTALQEFGLPPATLELEIPEMVLMGRVPSYWVRLDALKRLGVRIAVDNFGLGYAGLAALQNSSIDALKLDRSLIRDIAQPDADLRLPAAVIEMAHSLNLTVVAKGVETEGQAAFLREHDCNELQGLYFAEPMPAAAFEALLQGPADADHLTTSTEFPGA